MLCLSLNVEMPWTGDQVAEPFLDRSFGFRTVPVWLVLLLSSVLDGDHCGPIELCTNRLMVLIGGAKVKGVYDT